LFEATRGGTRKLALFLMTAVSDNGEDDAIVSIASAWTDRHRHLYIPI
jgi:hypothetical protein